MRWALLLVLAALPLQWFRLPGPGSLRLHQAVLVAVLLWVLVRLRASAFTPALRMTRTFVALNVGLFLVAGAAVFYHGDSPLRFAQQFLLIAIFVAISTLAYRAASGALPGAVELLRWSALVCSVVLLLALAFSMAVNGVNAVQVLSKAIATANPELLQSEIFHKALVGFGYEADQVKSNIRHEVFGAVLLALCISITAVRLRPLRSRAQRVLYTVSLVATVVMLLASLSRAVLLASLALPLFALVSALRAGGLTRNQLITIGSTVTIVGVLWITGLIGLVWARFTTDTTSYSSRDQLLQGALTEIRTHWLTGGVTVHKASSHNYVLDYWQTAGIFAAILALLVMLTVFAGWIMLIRRVGPREPWAMPLAAAIALPVVRFFTAGGGLMPPVQFVCLAMVAGLALGVLDSERRAGLPPVPGAPPAPPRPALALPAAR
jgi:hypothetical protein